MPLTAAYLGYDDLGQLRRFQTTHCFLEQYINFHDQQYHGFKGTFVFKILDAPESDLRESFMDASANPSANDDSHATRNARIANTIWTLVHECGAGAFDQDQQRQMGQQFTAKFSGKVLPSVGTENLVRPVLERPTDQSPLEKYNRAYELLRNFTTVLNKWTSWATDPFKHCAVSADLIPPFMRNQRDHEPTPEFNLAMQPTAKSFSITWRLKLDVRDNLEERLGPGGKMPPGTMSAPDPRQISRLEWMDKVKRLFEFESLKLQFQTLDFVYVHKNDDNFLNLIEGSDWSQLQAICNKTSDVSGEMFRFTTRDVQEGEVLFQYDGVPTQLADFVEMRDKIPVIRTLEDPKPNGPHSPPAGTPNPSLTAQKTANAFIKAYLAPAITSENTRDPTAGPGMPKPQRYYGSRLTEVRKEHDGYNILNNKELRQWQSKVIVECAGNTPIKEVAEDINLEVEAMLAGVKGEQDDEEMDNKALLRQMQLNAALSGSGPQLGPDVAISALVLGSSEIDDGLVRGKMLKTKVALYPWQVSGVVYMLMASFGHIPVNGLPDEHLNKPEVQEALERLKGLPMQGGFIVDQTGMGKTIQVLYYLSWVAKNHIESLRGRNHKTNKAKLIVAPTVLVEQWTEECANLFLGLDFGVMYAESDNMKPKVSALHFITRRGARDWSQERLSRVHIVLSSLLLSLLRS